MAHDFFIQLTPQTRGGDLGGLKALGLQASMISLPYIGWGIMVRSVPEGDLTDLVESMGGIHFN
jgi:hypothetical protein